MREGNFHYYAAASSTLLQPDVGKMIDGINTTWSVTFPKLSSLPNPKPVLAYLSKNVIANRLQQIIRKKDNQFLMIFEKFASSKVKKKHLRVLWNRCNPIKVPVVRPQSNELRKQGIRYRASMSRVSGGDIRFEIGISPEMRTGMTADP